MQRKMDEAEEGNHRSILQQKLDDMTEIITQVILPLPAWPLLPLLRVCVQSIASGLMTFRAREPETAQYPKST